MKPTTDEQRLLQRTRLRFDELLLGANYGDDPQGRAMALEGLLALTPDDAATIIERFARLTDERDLLKAKLDGVPL